MPWSGAAPEDLDPLRAMLRAPLPGHARFRSLSGYDRNLPPAPGTRESAVLVLLYATPTGLHTLLMQRPEYDGVHSAQIGFPGGKREPEDPDAEATALREFTEETGAAHTAFETLGRLSPVYIPPSRMLVTPVVAYAPELPPLQPDPREVAALIETPMQQLLRPDILKRTRVHVRSLNAALNVPYWDVQGHVVWGATALMIAELRELLLGPELALPAMEP